MLIKVIIVSIVGGIVCLDRIIVQAMISRPIVAGPITGCTLGDPLTGLVVGAYIELLWINRYPIGKYVPPNDSLVAILIVAGSVIAGSAMGGVSRELIALAMLLYIPVGIIGQRIDIFIFASNDALSQKAMEAAKAGDIRTVSLQHSFGILKTFCSVTGMIAVLLPLGIYLLRWLFPVVPGNILKALSWVYFFVPVVGVAVALTTIKLRGAIPVFSGIVLIVLLVRGIL